MQKLDVNKMEDINGGDTDCNTAIGGMGVAWAGWLMAASAVSGFGLVIAGGALFLASYSAGASGCLS